MTTELSTIEHSQTALDIRALMNRIQEVMKEVMISGTHYGTVPGCGDKPTLFKAGAEKLMMTFRLAVDPEVEDLSDTYTRRYRVRTRVTSQTSGVFLGTGVGECASDEEKYAWREAVCQEEYDATDPALRREKWKRSQKAPIMQVHTNISDVANTVLKMAKKRSMVDAILTVTGASDIFTQYIEEMPEELRGNGKAAPAKTAHSNEVCTPNYGPEPNVPLSEATIDHLKVYLGGAERSITDPKRANFIKENTRMRDALKAEIAKRDDGTVEGDGLGVQCAKATESTPPQQVQDASVPTDNPATPYIAKLNAAVDSKAVQAVWQEIPEELKQNCFEAYSTVLKSFNKKK